MQAGNLSYGDQRRLEMARALVTRPALVLLDEPTAGMNAVETHELGEHILSMRADWITVLVVEHDMALIGQVCDEVYVLNFGADHRARHARRNQAQPEGDRSLPGERGVVLMTSAA